MSNQQTALEAMLAQYESNNKPKYTPSAEAKVYDLKNYFNTYIPDGVKSATKQIRILPVANGGTPFVEFKGHKVQIEGEWKTFACLQHEKGEACPFCDARQLLLSTGNPTDKEHAKKFNTKLMYIVKVIDRENEGDGVKFWRFNHDYTKNGVYDKIIGVLNAIKKDVTDPETGRDLLLTINRDQNNRPVVSAVASLDPSPLTTDKEAAAEWLADVRTWEDVYAVRNYEYLEIIVKGGVPVWSKETNSFVDKASLKDSTESAKLEDEITMGIENVKSNITVAETTIGNPIEVESGNASDEDDMPF
jgi:hypothetical protein